MINFGITAFKMGCFYLCFFEKAVVSAFQHSIPKRYVRYANRALAVAASDWTTRSNSLDSSDAEVLDPLIVCGPR